MRADGPPVALASPSLRRFKKSMLFTTVSVVITKFQ
jgi:hypothetical protein